ncbi:MAG TPA: class I SAM-dependent methyltransferase, partial [Candidatus Tyrphobacter sp.]|nr:class I SAM-dependent methyltransferase [Candidatus Tyrphobacter sp.]
LILEILFMIALFVFILTPILLAAAVFFIFALDSLVRGHDLPTSRRAAKILVKIFEKREPRAFIFYDLGCGRGTLALAVKKALPEIEVYGFDLSPIRISLAKLKSFLRRTKVYFKEQDIFKTDLSRVDVVYTYLWYDLMPPLEEKLRRELKEGAMVITNTSKFPNWESAEKIVTYPGVSRLPDFETLFVYVKKGTNN